MLFLDSNATTQPEAYIKYLESIEKDHKYFTFVTVDKQDENSSYLYETMNITEPLLAAVVDSEGPPEFLY